MRLRDFEHLRAWVDGRYGGGVGESGSGFREYATAAANIEVAELSECRSSAWKCWFTTSRYKGMPQRVHKVKQARGAMWIPPTACESIEVGYLRGVDR